MQLDQKDLEKKVLLLQKHSRNGVRVELLKIYLKHYNPEAKCDKIMETADIFMNLLGYKRKNDYYVSKSI